MNDNNQTYASIPAIAEKLTQSFSEVASDDNYSREFIQYESTMEHRHVILIAIIVNHTMNPYLPRDVTQFGSHSQHSSRD